MIDVVVGFGNVVKEQQMIFSFRQRSHDLTVERLMIYRQSDTKLVVREEIGGVHVKELFELYTWVNRQIAACQEESGKLCQASIDDREGELKHRIELGFEDPGAL